MAGNSELTNEATILINEAEKTAEHNVQKSIKLIKKQLKSGLITYCMNTFYLPTI